MASIRYQEDFLVFVDIDEGLSRIQGNQKIYIVLLQTFVKSSYSQRITEEIRRGDLSAAAATAHAVKGMAANLSLHALRKSAANLEQALDNGTFTPEAMEQFCVTCDTTYSYVSALLSEIENGVLPV